MQDTHTRGGLDLFGNEMLQVFTKDFDIFYLIKYRRGNT